MYVYTEDLRILLQDNPSVKLYALSEGAGLMQSPVNPVKGWVRVIAGEFISPLLQNPEYFREYEVEGKKLLASKASSMYLDKTCHPDAPKYLLSFTEMEEMLRKKREGSKAVITSKNFPCLAAM